MMNKLSIGSRLVSVEQPPLVIAEIGINHGGNIDVAIEMADSAIDSGAEVVKHQTHVIEDEMSEEAKSIIPGNAEISIYEIMKQCALDEADEWRLMQHIESRGRIFISTPFSLGALRRLVRFDVPAFKIGSGECNNYPFVREVAKVGKPMIVSTGMNSINNIRRTVQILRDNSIDFALLHCTNVYPTPPELVRLGALEELQNSFPDAVIGLSDHTQSNHSCFAAVALGALIVERHFTDSMEREGPDIICSMDPSSLTDMILGTQNIFMAKGGVKGALEEESSTIKFAFTSVVASKELNKGESLTSDNVWLMRPGTGDFGAADYDGLLGSVTCRAIKMGKQISKQDLEQ
ncbi:N-acetylneuraminate synthase family protein [Candidatus Puniceispirillum sp.]|nr:N-acetylneuraminate synthase family protein [Candidatus Puniceispirillum sp.]